MPNNNDRNQSHIFLNDNGIPKPYKPVNLGRNKNIDLPKVQRKPHANKLIRDLNIAKEFEKSNREEIHSNIARSKDGYYLEFEFSSENSDFIEQLEYNRGNKEPIELMSVKKEEIEDSAELLATVYVPDSREEHFTNKIEDFRDNIDKRNNKPKNANLISTIKSVKLGSLSSLFVGPGELPENRK